jgi:hypothetical protein
VRTRLSGGRRIRSGVATGAALLALTATVAGCSSDDEGGEPIDGAQSGSPEPSQSTDNGNADDTAALEDLYADYWDARIELENSEDLDSSVFDGITTSPVKEMELTRLQPFREDGIHRQGEPEIEDVTVSVDGDAARIESCKSEADWQVIQNGEVVPDAVPENLRQPHPYVVSAERSPEGWLITGTVDSEEATITCA